LFDNIVNCDYVFMFSWPLDAMVGSKDLKQEL